MLVRLRVFVLIGLVGIVIVCGCKAAPPAPKTNPDMGTQGGATQVDTETH